MIQTIKMLANITTNDRDPLIQYHIDSITQKILNYCNIQELPQALEYIVIEKVVSILSVGGGQLVEGSGAVKKVSRGDTTVEYDVGTSVVGGTKYNENSLDDVRAQLNAFRRVKLL